MSVTLSDGTVVEPWLYRPDGEVLERLEWQTDVIPAFDGSEQRIELRTYPRRGFEFQSAVSDRDRREAENLLYSWQANVFALPIWMDTEVLTASLPASSSSIPVTTSGSDYHVGGLVGLMSDPRTFELLEISSVGGSSIGTTQPTASTWAPGTLVFPMRTVRMQESQRLARFTGGDAYGRIIWSCVDDSAVSPASETTYRSFPVLTLKTDWTEDLAQDYGRKLKIFDPGVGKRFWEDESELPSLLQTHRWALDGRAQIHAFRQWLYARKGRLTAFWVPTWARDFLVVDDIGSSDTTIDVEHSRYADLIDQAVNRRDIRIELLDGTVFYRRITNCTEISGSVERLTIDSSLGQAVDNDEIALVSFMHLARLDADAAEINWWKWDFAESALTFRGFRNGA